MNKVKLKPCPFCGGKVKLVCYLDDGTLSNIESEEELESTCSFVHCYNCNSDFFPNKETAMEVLKAWNTRKPVDNVLKQLEEAKIEYNKNYHKTVCKNDIGISATLQGNIHGIELAMKIINKEVGSMTNQEAIQGLKNLFSEHELDLPNSDSLEILKMATKALESQISVDGVLKQLEEKKEQLYNARTKLSEKMYVDSTAFNRVQILQAKELSLHEAIEIIKGGGVDD